MSSDALREVFADAAQYFPTPLQQFQFFDKYSRFNYDLKRRETWTETVDRAVEYLSELAPEMATWLRTEGRHMILTLQAMPSMRLLAMAGPAARRQNLCIYNCAYLPVDDIQAFVEMLIISMSGCGVGFSVEHQNVNKLPIVALQRVEHEAPVHVVEDSTEGWAAALRLGLETWFGGGDVVFDFSQVRAAGAPLRTKGGRASGPRPLRRLLAFVRKTILSRQGESLRTIDAHDIACAVGDAAVSGGMRRTAMISLYSQDDELMRHAKQGKFPEIRWNANNSEVWRKDPSDLDILQQMTAMFAAQNGEPGIFSGAAAARTMPSRRREIWQTDLGVTVDADVGVNPCQPGWATVLTPDGVRTFNDIDVGSTIWSGQRWTKVVRKLTTGIKPVLLYRTRCGHFIGTEDHQVIANGQRIAAGNAHFIDSAPLPADWIAEERWPSVVFDYSFLPGSEPQTVEEVISLGNHPVYDITVEAAEHTYWTGGLLVSNCGEVLLRPRGLCNLSIAVARADDTITTLERKVRAAAIFGTIQATATHFPGLRPEWRQNAEAERLLGVDITGQMDCPLLTGPHAAHVFDTLKRITIAQNVETAAAIGTSASLAATVVKPGGNSSSLINCGSGLHGRHARFYVRNVRVSAHSPVYKVLREAGAPLSPENGQTVDDATTWVCSFPCRAPDGAVVKGELSALRQLDHWLLNKLHWTEHNPSCFTGDQRFITLDGLRRFDSYEDGQAVTVLNSNGDWINGQINHFTPQKIWEITLERSGITHKIRTTGNHVWPITTPMRRYAQTKMSQLRTDQLHLILGSKTHKLDTVVPHKAPLLDPTAVLHGIVYGDGTKTKQGSCQIYLCNDPQGCDSRHLASLFKQAGYKLVQRPDIAQIRIYGLPSNWKCLPNKHATPSYLRGFIAGWFAADGSVGRNISLACRDRSALVWLQDVAPRAGLAVSTAIGKHNSKEHGSFKASVHYTIGLTKTTLNEDFFVLPDKKAKSAKSKKYWKIVDVAETDLCEPVYCVQEPRGQHFVLEGNILTHNCTITYRSDEMVDIVSWLRRHRDVVGGLSFLPHSDAAYEQMPYVEIDEAEYERRLAAFPAIDWSRIVDFEDHDETTASQELACTGDRCEL